MKGGKRESNELSDRDAPLSFGRPRRVNGFHEYPNIEDGRRRTVNSVISGHRARHKPFAVPFTVTVM